MGGKISFPRQPVDRERTVIVTGGNTGIGYETAKWISFLGAKVIIACRSEQRAKQAIDTMKKEFQIEKAGGTDGVIQDNDIDIEFMQLNLSSLSSTKRFIDEFKSSGRKLHVLVCNAGIALHEQEYTEDGNEIMLQVNYLSHLLMALHLIPVMKASGSDDCRIVLVSSAAHAFAGSFDISTIQGNHVSKENFDRLQYYGKSKLYMEMQMFYMNRKLKGTNVTVTSLHPGMVKTELTRSFQDLTRWKAFTSVAKTFGFMKSSQEGAESSINAAINPELKGVRDVYYVDCKPATISAQASNIDFQEELMKFSFDRLKDFLTEDIINEWI